MIKEELLKKLLKKYGLNPEETIKHNENILNYIDYYEAEQILKYLIKDKKIKPQKIEKAPSILCFSNLQNIKKIMNF